MKGGGGSLLGFSSLVAGMELECGGGGEGTRKKRESRCSVWEAE